MCSPVAVLDNNFLSTDYVDTVGEKYPDVRLYLGNFLNRSV